MAMPAPIIGLRDDSSDEPALTASINTTPLVDIMLVLLIIFLITVPVVTHSIPVNLPNEVNQPTQTKPQNIVIAVDKDGNVYWNDAKVADNDTLLNALKSRSVENPQPEVHIRDDKDARYEFVGQRVIVDCQRTPASPRSPSSPLSPRPRHRRRGGGIRRMAINLNQGGGDNEPMVDINTTPLIDVMLVLLGMLIITIPVQTHAVKLDMPRDNPPPVTTQPDGGRSADRFRRHRHHLERSGRARPHHARARSRDRGASRPAARNPHQPEPAGQILLCCDGAGRSAAPGCREDRSRRQRAIYVMTCRSVLLSTLVLAALLAAPVHADAQQTARPQIGQPVEQAGQLLKQKKYKDALGKLATADGVPDKTAYERHIIEGTRAAIDMNSGDYAGAVKALQADIATGILSPQDTLVRLQSVVQLDYQLKNYPQTVTDATAYYQKGGTADDPRLLMAQAYFLQNDYANAAKTIRTILAADDKAGKKPDEQVLLTLLNSDFQMKDTAGRVDTLERLVAAYPKKDYWTDLLTTVGQKPGFAGRLALDLDRLKLAAGALTKPAEYMDAAQLALLAGLPGDAKTIVDKGTAAGVFASAADADRAKRLTTMATTQAADDAKTVAKQESDAAVTPNGSAWEKLGEIYASDGQYDKAIAAYQKAIQKGGLPEPRGRQAPSRSDLSGGRAKGAGAANLGWRRRDRRHARSGAALAAAKRHLEVL